MRPKTAAILSILVSLLCAAAILVADAIFEGTEHNAAIRHGLIALWWVPFLALTRRSGCCARRC